MIFAYLSGYIDGDGSIYCRQYIQSPSIKVYECSIQICSVNQEICQYFQTTFGGNFHKRPEKRKDRRDTWLWYCKGTKCHEILSNCASFLILKKKSSDLCISLINEIRNTITYKNKKISETQHEYRINIIKQIKSEIHMNNLINEENFETLKEYSQIHEPTQEDYAYLAGLIDAEGCFRIQHWKDKRKGRGKNFVITLEIGNTKFPIFPWLIQRFGGSVIYRKPSKKQFNPMIIWSLRSKSLFIFLERIYPFLRIKKERCRKLMEFYETKIPTSVGRTSDQFKILAEKTTLKREKLIEEFHLLNKKGKH